MRRPAAVGRRIGDHPRARRGGCPIIFPADQDERRHPRAPVRLTDGAAAGIEGHRRAEIRQAVAPHFPWLHRPQGCDCAVRPAEQRDPVLDDVGLTLQPAPGDGRIVDAFDERAHPAVAGAALRPEPTRAETIGEQHQETGGSQSLAPVRIVCANLSGAADDAVAAVQRHHGRKRPWPLGPVEHRVEGRIAARNFNLLHSDRRCRERDQTGGESQKNSHGADHSA